MKNVFYEVDETRTRWGGYETLSEYSQGELKTKLKVLIINPNENLSYQKHEKRAEAWTVLRGSGVVVVNEEVFHIGIGVSISIPVGFWHTVKAGEEGLEIAEVQVGTECEEDDVERMFYEWTGITAHVYAKQEELANG